MKLNWNFQRDGEGGGLNHKTVSGGAMIIFLNNTIDVALVL